MSVINLKRKEWFGVSIVSLLFIASYARLYFGVDLQDESFYIAIPYRFILGDRFLINENNICQLAGILLFPLYKLFFSIQHNTNGIVLYGRHLYFIFFTALSFLTYVVLRKDLGKNVALILATTCILYIPYNIMALSYNTLGILFFTSGALFILLDYQHSFVGNWRLITAGFLYSLAIFSYPPLLIPIGVGSILAASINGFKRTTTRIFMGALPLLVVFIFIGVTYKKELINIYYYLQFTNHTHKNASVALKLVKNFINDLAPLKFTLFLVSGLIFFNFKDWFLKNIPSTNRIINIWGQASLVLLPTSLIAAYLTMFFYQRAIIFLIVSMIYLSLLAPFYFRLTNHPDFSKKLFILIWIPSFIAGFTTAVVSGTEFANAAVGLMPAFIVSLVMVYLALHKFFNEDISYKKDLMSYCKIIPIITISAFFSLLIVFKFFIVLRDDPIKFLKLQVATGPYKYLFTTENKIRVLDQVEMDLSGITRTFHPSTILIYPRTFGFYLMTGLKPLTNSIWVEAAENNPLVINYFQQVKQKPEVAVIINSLVKQPHDQLFQYINSSDYYKVIDRGGYSIFILKNLLSTTSF